MDYRCILLDNNPLPNWLKFDSVSLIFSGTPSFVQSKQLYINITADDGAGGLTTNTFFISIFNNPPISRVIENKTYQPAGQSFQFSFDSNIFFDNDNDSLILSALINDSISPSWIKYKNFFY